MLPHSSHPHPHTFLPGPGFDSHLWLAQLEGGEAGASSAQPHGRAVTAVAVTAAAVTPAVTARAPARTVGLPAPTRWTGEAGGPAGQPW